MRNPFRSEADAFRFVWLTIGYFVLIFVGSLINLWFGIAVFIVVTAVAFRWFFRRDAREAPVKQTPAASPPGEYRILVVANETVGGAELLSEIRERSRGRDARVLVVCPALNSPLRHWVSDEDDARAAAQARLDESLAAMLAAGLAATGEIGDGDPIQAIEDALRTFQPDELIISTHPAGRSHWLERGVVEKARERFNLPVTHVVVDLELDPAEPR
jgi:GABA permease